MARNIQWYGWQKDSLDNRDFKYSAPRTVVAALPPKVDLTANCPPVFDQGALGSCHDDKTEVLTETGWMLFSDLSEQDRLATVDPKTSVLIFELPRRLIKIDYNGDMFYGEHRSVDFAVTPDHKMLVRKWNERQKMLDSEYQLVAMKDIGWYVGFMSSIVSTGEGNCGDSYVLKGVAHKHSPIQRSGRDIPLDVWLNFIGIYLAEGTMIHEEKGGCCKNKIQIAASKPRERGFVAEVLAKIGVKACVLSDRFTFENKQIYTALQEMGLKGVKAPDKFVPDFVFELPGSMIEHILYGHFMGDGCEQNGHISHYTSSKRLADDLQRLALLSGRWANIGSRPPRVSVMSDGRVVRGRHPEYRVGIWGGDCGLSLEKKTNVVVKNYKGFVYCAEMPTYHTMVTRRNGKILISGNCTANAIGSAHQFEQIKQDHSKDFVPSRLFIYWNEREMEGTIESDSGAQIRDGIKSVVKQGVCHESQWGYDINKFRVKPPVECYTDALRHQVLQYLSIRQTLDQLKGCLASGYPIIFGFMVYDSFETDTVSKTGVVPMPAANENLLGGHAVLAVGYDDATQRFIVRNSWGEDWGQQGNFTMPYAYLTNPNLASDFWTIRTVEIPTEPDPAPVPTPDPTPTPQPPKPSPSWPCDWSLMFPATKAFVDSAVAHADMVKAISNPVSTDRMFEAGLRGLQQYLVRVQEVRDRKA